MKEIDILGIIDDYTLHGFGVEGIAKKYHVGKKRVKAILGANSIPRKHRGKQPLNEVFVVDDHHIKKYEEHDGFHYIAVDENTGFTTKDYMNRAGVLTTYIEKTYNKEIPNLYHRDLYYKRTGNYWWEQWFRIVEVENKPIKKCPYCDWHTNDVENKSGAFEVHLFTKHNITKQQYLLEHPEDREYFRLVNKTLDRQMENDNSKFVTCKICGKKLSRITDCHLKSHDIDRDEYIKMFGSSDLVSDELHDKMSKISIEANENMVRTFTSKDEAQIKEYITSLGFECDKNRKILHGKELDIYIPSKQIAIEYNGNLWHTEKFGKNKKYHLNKLIECNRNGVKLIQIFEDEYAEHKDLVLSKIRHILCADGVCLKVAARKCDIRHINHLVAKDFLNINHIQGFATSSVYYGAFYNNELVGVMLFKIREDGIYELIRYATKQGTICQGLGSKMFTHFIREYNPDEVISFADRRWTIDSNNNLYTKLGFELDSVTRPDYRYYNPRVDRYKRFHKFGFRKQILHKKYDLSLTMTEQEMTKKLGYSRIWDCGLFKYVWKNNEKG